MIDLHGGPRSAWLALATGRRERIGYEIQGRTWMYTRAVARPRDAAPAAFGRQPVGPARSDRRLAARGAGSGARSGGDAAGPGARRRAIAQRLDAAGVTPEHELIVVHVSAGNPFRRWPEPAFAALVAGLAPASPSGGSC